MFTRNLLKKLTNLKIVKEKVTGNEKKDDLDDLIDDLIKIDNDRDRESERDKTILRFS